MIIKLLKLIDLHFEFKVETKDDQLKFQYYALKYMISLTIILPIVFLFQK